MAESPASAEYHIAKPWDMKHTLILICCMEHSEHLDRKHWFSEILISVSR